MDLTNRKVEAKLGVNLEQKTLTSAFAREKRWHRRHQWRSGRFARPEFRAGRLARRIWVSLGKELLHENATYPAPFLSFDQENHPSLISSAFTNRAIPSTAYNAIWGRWDVLINGAIQGTDFVTRQPRTAMAVSQDGTRLFLMVADGRQRAIAAV